MNGVVEVVPYDDRWPAAFRSENRRLAGLLGPAAPAIHHIGSTSVPGLCSKPVLDVLVETPDLALIDQLEPELSATGYVAKGEHGIAGRRYFSRPAGSEFKTHVHVFREADPAVGRHLRFRDYLRLHSDVAAEYCALKRQLAHAHERDAEAYQAEKSAFIDRVEALAMNACTLCGAPAAPPAREAFGRHFLDCPNCGLVRGVPKDLPSPEVERARYASHENDPADPRYRAFLDRLAIPLGERLPAGARGLDFGCGPGPTLSGMLTERGWPTADWDPFFAPDGALLAERWDFVTCSEVLEHLHHPRRTLDQIRALLRPGGWLGVMTEVFDQQVDFATWWYVRDPTHVAFYRPRTLTWIAEHFGWSLERPARNVALYRTP